MSSENFTKVTLSNNQFWIKPEVVSFFMTFNLLICANIIAVLGIVGNVLCIVNFSKEGFQDGVNISLSALAISDIGALVIQTIMCVLLSPFWKNVDIMFTSAVVFSTLFLYIHEYFVRVSGLITCFATFERCLCVVIPVKVKAIITRNVSLAFNVLIFIIFLIYLFPTNFATYLDWAFDSKKNQTKLTFFYRSNSEYILRISYLTTDLFIPYFTISVLIICNTVIVFKLKSKAKWRKSVTGKKLTPGTEISGKERKLVVMLTTVSVIFIACLTPQSAMLTALGLVRELKLNGPYFDISLMVYSFNCLLENVNCSVNILVYYKMSSKFKAKMRVWVPCLQTKHTNRQ